MLTLTQLYNLGKSVSNVDIFDGLILPDDSPLDRDTLINTILVKNGLNIPMYADPIIFKSAVSIWSAKNQYTFIHVGKIFNAEYSPIENTDRYDSITVERSRDMTDNTVIDNDKTENARTTNHNTNTHTGTDTTTVTDDVSADNVSDYSPKEQTETANVYGSTLTDNGGGTVNRTTNIDGTNDKTIDEDETTTTTQHLHGNIGVSTNTQLQTEEYELLAKFNPYDFIAGLFENELTLFVY